MPIKAVLFDLDGTLIDTSDLIFRSFEYALDTVLHTQIPREELLWTFGRPLEQIMKNLGGERADELLKAFRAYSISHETDINLFPQVHETLAYLRAKGIKTAIVTSRIRPSTMRDLEILQLNSALFDAIITPESTIEHKPHPAPALKAMELLDVAPEETIMIGDSVHDLQCGREAGCHTAFVQYSMVPQEELRAQNPDYSVASLSDLIDILQLK
ncbi:MAG: HAD-IA family hydrolase [Peptococcaceae bacterium]|nr:HAD-IA family hydrolase [Peptococcaceae bacterium]